MSGVYAAPAVEPLTEDDQAVLECIRDGLTIERAARRLGITHGAATMRLARLRQRYGAATTAQLVAVLFDWGLLTPRREGEDQWPGSGEPSARN